MQIQVGESIAKGSQVHMNYGQRANDHFVQFYGFAMPDNADEVRAKISKGFQPPPCRCLCALNASPPSV